MPIGNDGMKDISPMVRKTIAVKNILTGLVLTKEGVANYQFWENIVRHADQHQEEYEFTFDGKSKVVVPEDDEDSEFSADGGVKVTAKWLASQHYMTLQKKAKELGADHTGTKKDLIERILERV